MPLDISTDQIASWVFSAAPYIAGVLFFLYILLGGILDFHWRTYGVGIIRLFAIRVTYIVVGFILLSALIVTLNTL